MEDSGTLKNSSLFTENQPQMQHSTLLIIPDHLLNLLMLYK